MKDGSPLAGAEASRETTPPPSSQSSTSLNSDEGETAPSGGPTRQQRNARGRAARAAARRAEEVRVEEAKERRWDEENKKRERDGKEKISKEDWEKAEDAEKKTKAALERLMAAAATAARMKYAEVRAREGAAADRRDKRRRRRRRRRRRSVSMRMAHVDRDEEKNDQRVWLRRYQSMRSATPLERGCDGYSGLLRNTHPTYNGTSQAICHPPSCQSTQLFFARSGN